MWSRASPNSAGILAQGDVADVMELVLDRPMAPTEVEQVARAGLFRRQAGDLVVQLHPPVAAPPDLVQDAADLADTGPRTPALQTGLHVQGADLGPAVGMVDGLGGIQRVERVRKGRLTSASRVAWLSLTSKR